MTVDLVALGALAGSASPRQLAVLMIPIGAAAPLVILAGHRRTARQRARAPLRHRVRLVQHQPQVGGALGVAVFGGLLADPDTISSGVRLSLLAAAAVLAAATGAAATLRPTTPIPTTSIPTTKEGP